jgi:hypothetical protein
MDGLAWQLAITGELWEIVGIGEAMGLEEPPRMIGHGRNRG